MNSTETCCPICDGVIQLTSQLEVSEIISCPECGNRLVVESTEGTLALSEAPEIDEDWGE